MSMPSHPISVSTMQSCASLFSLGKDWTGWKTIDVFEHLNLGTLQTSTN